MTLKEEIEAITDDYGQLHEDECDLHNEDGTEDGCTCAVKGMTREIVERMTEYFSHDITFKDEAQRKAAVEMYMEDWNPQPKKI